MQDIGNPLNSERTFRGHKINYLQCMIVALLNIKKNMD